MNADAVAVVATERSTPAVSITSVWPAAIRPRIAAYRNVVESWFGGEERLARLRTVDDVGRDEERDEDARQHGSRIGGERLTHVEALRARGGLAHPPDLPFCRIASPPIITTSTISDPWITCA